MSNPSRDELKLTVKLDKTHKFDLNVDLDVNKTEINEELSGQPASFAWYATLHELAKSKVQTLKYQLELLESQLDQDFRKNWDAKVGNIKMTEASLQAVIKATPDYQELMETYLEAQKNQGILGVAKQAFEQRKDMLISISANMRGESDTELKVNKEKIKESISKLRKPS